MNVLAHALSHAQYDGTDAVRAADNRARMCVCVCVRMCVCAVCHCARHTDSSLQLDDISLLRGTCLTSLSYAHTDGIARTETAAVEGGVRTQHWFGGLVKVCRREGDECVLLYNVAYNGDTQRGPSDVSYLTVYGAPDTCVTGIIWPYEE
jgi:hypothetical protein